MAKKNYKRRDSGLIVADDSIVVPKAGGTIPRPWWSSPYIPTAARATSQIKFVDDPPQILFVDGKICFSPECCCESAGECSHCGSSYVPNKLWVTISNITDYYVWPCGFSSTFAGTYGCDWLSQGAGSICYWVYGVYGVGGPPCGSPSICGDYYNCLEILVRLGNITGWTPAAGYGIGVSVSMYTGGCLTFFKSLTYPVDCTDDIYGSISFHGASGCGSADCSSVASGACSIG